MCENVAVRQIDELNRHKCKTEYADMMLFNLCSNSAVISDDNDIEVFTDGRKKFTDMLYEMDKAEKYIHIQYYIIKDDSLFHNIEEILVKKAALGVEVRVLLDGIGGRYLKQSAILRMKRSGIEVGTFYPSWFGCVNMRINHRNHRKVAVIDGVGYVGGFNIGEEYLGYDKRFGNWRDTHFKIRGSAVKELQKSFAEDWKKATGKELADNKKYFEDIKKSNSGKIKVQIIKSGYPSSFQIIRDNYLKIIYQAKKNIYMQTPYFVPDSAVMDAIKSASLSGVEVKIMVPGTPDHPCVFWTTGCYVGKVLSAGVKVYRYMGGFLHAKGLMADGKICTFGTTNADIRSFSLNFEINALIYDKDFTVKMENIFLDDLNMCEEVSSYRYKCRGIAPRIKGWIFKIGAKFM